jgi:predicted HTH domain antitoxin
MILSVELPDAFARQLHLDGAEGPRRALEKFALEGYRAGELSRGQVSELLDMEFNETERFLKEHGCGLGMSFEEYEQDSKRLREFLAR